MNIKKNEILEPNDYLTRDFLWLKKRAKSAKNPQEKAKFAEQQLICTERAKNWREKLLKPEQIKYPDLPVAQFREKLIQAIQNHQVIVVTGETGSGKTTQLPKICLEAGRGFFGKIGHTQPRRLAARAVAERIAHELSQSMGGFVGLETRFERRANENTVIKLMTDGILLAELQRDRLLAQYDTIIIDEAHERSLNIDFLLGCLKQILPKRPDLRVIITSATLAPEKFAEFFGEVPLIAVPGRSFPVDVLYQPPEPDEELADQVQRALRLCWGARPRAGEDVLVFLPGERDIHDVQKVLRGNWSADWVDILPLYARLPNAQQDRVFQPSQKAKVILSTNVAETSLTVPGIRYVIDSGLAKVNRFNPRLGLQQLQEESIAQANAQQRAGRCGRVAAGVCVRLYDEINFQARPLYATPEILRTHLAGVILTMLALNLGEPAAFPWLDAPDGRYWAEGFRLLEWLGALAQNTLTPLGKKMARLPFDPRLARMMVAAEKTPVQARVWVIACALAIQDPQELPMGQESNARAQHAAWNHDQSDFIKLLKLWRQWCAWQQTLSKAALRRECQKRYVNFMRMQEWTQLYAQACDFFEVKPDFSPDAFGNEVSDGSDYALIHQNVLTGLLDHIGQKQQQNSENTNKNNINKNNFQKKYATYHGTMQRKFVIFPGSVLAKKSPDWLMSAQIVHTSQIFARINAQIDVTWLNNIGAHLMKKSAEQPIWSAESAMVYAKEQWHFLGLYLGQKRVHYGASEPEKARKLLIEHGLVLGEWQNKPAFLQANLDLIEQIREQETRLRRPDLLVDEASLTAFYEARLPLEICTGAALKKWLHGQPNALRLASEDVLRASANTVSLAHFPEKLNINKININLTYLHDPASARDGVHFQLPLYALDALPERIFEWLVPGLLRDKFEALIRTLPKAQRLACSPAAQFAQVLWEIFESDLLPRYPNFPDDMPELTTWMAENLTRITGKAVDFGDFDESRLEFYLLPNFVILDQKNILDINNIQNNHDFLAIKKYFAAKTQASLTKIAQHHAAEWQREGVKNWDFGDLPEKVLVKNVELLPFLVISEQNKHQINLILGKNDETNQQKHKEAFLLWFAQHHKNLFTQFQKNIKNILDSHKTSQIWQNLNQIYAQKIPQNSVESWAEKLFGRAMRDFLASFLNKQRMLTIRNHAEWQLFLAESTNQADGLGVFVANVQQNFAQISALNANLRKIFAQKIKTGFEKTHADLQTQLDQLWNPETIAAMPAENWARLPVYFKAMEVRWQRAEHKLSRDLAQMNEFLPFLPLQTQAHLPARWLLEEWRIALFAQELKAHGNPSASKLRS